MNVRQPTKTDDRSLTDNVSTVPRFCHIASANRTVLHAQLALSLTGPGGVLHKKVSTHRFTELTINVYSEITPFLLYLRRNVAE